MTTPGTTYIPGIISVTFSPFYLGYEQVVKSAVDVEEALRLKVLAAVASKKGQQTQDDR